MQNSYVIENDVLKIELNSSGQKVYALLDPEWQMLLDKIDGRLHLAKGYVGYSYNTGEQYAIPYRDKAGNIKKSTKQSFSQLHRIIVQCPPGLHVDHINGNKLDNRKCNLRIVTNAENCQNQKISKNNSTGFRNVYCRNRGSYTVYEVNIRIDDKLIYIGSSRDIEEANQMAIKARKKYFPFSTN